MAIDPSKCHKLNMTDTCAVWNLLSSRVLYAAAISGKFCFSVTYYVLYEAIYKRRSSMSTADKELLQRLEAQRRNGAFQDYHLDIADLQDMGILERRKRLGKGELSSIVFARKTRQAFLTDDQKARKLAAEVMDKSMVQTTPHVLSSLFFEGILSDGDKDGIIKEHTSFNRPLGQYFEEAYLEACRCRCFASGWAANGTPDKNASVTEQQGMRHGRQTEVD